MYPLLRLFTIFARSKTAEAIARKSADEVVKSLNVPIIEGVAKIHNPHPPENTNEPFISYHTLMRHRQLNAPASPKEIEHNIEDLKLVPSGSW